MLNASRLILDKAQRIASHVLEVSPTDLVFAAGRFTVAGTDRSLGLFEIARVALERSDLPEELRGKLDAISDETMPDASFPYGCHVCEVEVDPDTGVTRIERYTAVDDVGRAVNPMIVHGQVHGGIVQGVGQAMGEQCVYDPESGQLLSGSFMDYTMPRADTLPFFDHGTVRDSLDHPSPRHPSRRRRRHHPGARRHGERGGRCAVAARRDARGNAADRRTGVAGHPGRACRLTASSAPTRC